MNPNAPPEQKNKILHAEFRTSSIKLLASDSFDGPPVGSGAPNTALSLDYPDSAKAKQVFD